jgi:ribosomal protein S11
MTALTNFRIDPDTRRAFHIWCIQNDTSISARLRQLIEWDMKGTLRFEQPKQIKQESAAKVLEQKSQKRRWEDSY